MRVELHGTASYQPMAEEVGQLVGVFDMSLRTRRSLYVARIVNQHVHARVLSNLKNPSRLTKQVFLPAGQMDLPGALLLWAKEHGLIDGEQASSHASALPVEGGGRSAASRG
jgi:hypothetical protein